MTEPIYIAGRQLSRAWQAVALAASDDEASRMYRAVHVEQFVNGVRLIATDSYWMSICWVPAEIEADDDSGELVAGEHFDAEPTIDEIPICAVTIRDDEYLVRDLMKHVAKLTRKSEWPDVPILVDLSAAPPEESGQPTLPDMAPVRCRFEIPASLRVLASTMEGVYPTWRALDQQAFAEWKTEGATNTSMSWWMLDKLAKVPRIVGAAHINLTWLDEQRARWSVEQGRMASPPRGLFMAARGANKDPDPPADEDGDGPDTPWTQPEIPLADSDDLDELFADARALVLDRQSASIRMIYSHLHIGPDRAKTIAAQLQAAGVISAPSHTGRREVLLDHNGVRQIHTGRIR